MKEKRVANSAAGYLTTRSMPSIVFSPSARLPMDTNKKKAIEILKIGDWAAW
jgi:hypothetical protein